MPSPPYALMSRSVRKGDETPPEGARVVRLFFSYNAQKCLVSCCNFLLVSCTIRLVAEIRLCTTRCLTSRQARPMARL